MIRYYLKRNTGNRSAVIASLQFGGKPYRYATGVSVAVLEWDAKRQRSATEPDNVRLSEFSVQLQTFLNTHGRPPTAAELEKGKPEGTTLLEAVASKAANLFFLTGKPNSQKAYTTLAAKIRQYSPDALTTDVTAAWIRNFAAWIKGQGFADTHTQKLTKTLRAVLNFADTATDWKKAKPIQAAAAEMDYLTPEQVGTIEALQFKQPHLQNAVRLFLLGVYSGQRFSDWGKVVAATIRDNIIQIKQDKGGKRVSIPVTPKLAALLEHPPHIISNQKANIYLKTVAKAAKIPFTLTTHTARRTFATNAVAANIPHLQIMKVTGHSTLAAFQTYVRFSDEEAANALLKTPHFQ